MALSISGAFALVHVLEGPPGALGLPFDLVDENLMPIYGGYRLNLVKEPPSTQSPKSEHDENQEEDDPNHPRIGMTAKRD